MKAIITRLNDLRKKVKLPYVPITWVGLIFWVMLVGALVLNLPAYVVYIILSLLFIDKLMMMAQFYSALAAAKSYNYTLQAVIQTQMLVEEKDRLQHRKTPQPEEE